MRSILLLLLCWLPLAAAEPPIPTLTADQIDYISRHADTLKTSSSAREEVTAWAELGAHLGQAMVAAAKELGVAAADFARTPLGFAIAAVIFLKIIGGKLLVAVFGLCCWTPLVLFTVWYIHKRILSYPIYETKPFLWGTWQRRVRVRVERSDALNGNDDNWHVASFAVIIVGLIGSLLMVVLPLANL